MASAQLICDIADVRRTTRDLWAQHNWLRRRPRNAYEEIDVVELVIFKELHQALESDIAVVWPELRTTVSSCDLVAAPLQELDGLTLDLLVDLRTMHGWLLDQRSDLWKLVVHDHPFRLLALTERVTFARSTFVHRTQTNGRP